MLDVALPQERDERAAEHRRAQDVAHSGQLLVDVAILRDPFGAQRFEAGAALRLELAVEADGQVRHRQREAAIHEELLDVGVGEQRRRIELRDGCLFGNT